ncbi:MAG TPA: hypothetical protein VM032_18840 [Vicinamibacterales bacterium]|nr:hypothetical protein [Vicinamibacterales bacterium]
MRQVFAVLVAVGLAAGSVAAQQGAASAPGNWRVPRTADGHPDFQGVWSNNGITPMTRPTQWKDKGPYLTNAEVEDLKQTLARFVDQGGDAIFGNVVQLALNAKDTGKFNQTSYDPTTGNYNQFWMADRDIDNRTSLIIDPPDGQFPPLTPEGAARRALGPRRAVVVEGSESGERGPADGPEDRPLSERCITYGVPRLQANYNSYFQIVQSPETVVIYQEMIHDGRMVNMSTAPHLPSSVRQLHGDPRGHWEGDTLVVESTNFVNGFQGSTNDVKITERFSRLEADHLNWTITVEDPKTWTAPFTFMIRLKRTDDQVYEYACHEGNHSMIGILAGARADEKRAAQSAARGAAAKKAPADKKP